MKFKAKPREVTVGLLKQSPTQYAPYGAQLAVIDLETRRAEAMSVEDFVEKYEPADADAEMMFEGLKSRPKPPNPFEPQPVPEDDFDGFQIEDPEGGRSIRMRPIRKPKKDD